MIRLRKHSDAEKSVGLMALVVLGLTLILLFMHDQQRTQIEDLQVDVAAMEVELEAKHKQLALLTKVYKAHTRADWLDDIAEGKR